MSVPTPKQEKTLKRMTAVFEIAKYVFFAALVLSFVFMLIYAFTGIGAMRILEFIMFGFVLLAMVTLFVDVRMLKRYCQKNGLLPEKNEKD